jgi:hypothetical protein
MEKNEKERNRVLRGRGTLECHLALLFYKAEYIQRLLLAMMIYSLPDQSIDVFNYCENLYDLFFF